MAENYRNPYEADPYEEGSSFSDYPKVFGARVLGMGADLAATARAIGESKRSSNEKADEAVMYLGRAFQNLFGGMEDATLDSLSETSKRDLQSTFTDPNFWSLNSFALKSASMAPDVVAAVVPSIIFPGTAAAIGIAAAQGGAFSATSVVDDMYRRTDELSDVDLQRQSEMYRQLRADGIDEETARAQYNKVFRGLRPLLTGAVGTITNVLGPAGQAARVAGGAGADVAGGVLSRIAGGAAEGAAAEAVQSGVEDYVAQEGAVETGLQDSIDYGQVAESAATGAVLGGVLGGAISGVGGHGRDNIETDPLIDQALNADSTPPEMASQPSQSGMSATPGVNDVTAASTDTATTPGPTVAQQMQARKNFGVDYGELTPEQVASIDEKLVGRGQPVNEAVSVVPDIGPDAAQTEALVSTKEDGAPPSIETPAEIAVNGVPAEAAVVAPEPQVTTQGNEPAPVQEIPESNAVSPEMVAEATQTPEASPRAAVAEPEAVQAEATPKPEQATGPRILRDLTAPDFVAENAAIVARNIRAMEEGEGATPKGRNRTVAEQEARTKVRDGAALLAEKYPPRKEEAGLLSTKPAEVTQARRIILDRAKAISSEAGTMGLALPKAFRNNTGEGQGYNPETLLVMEAKRLASLPSPKKADYARFMNRELDVRSGNLEQAVSERRAEGDAAMRQTSELQIDDITEGSTPRDMRTPEDHLIEAEEAGLAPRRSREIKPGKSEKTEDIPERVERAMQEVLYTTPKTDARKPAVEVRKNRKVTKPGNKPEPKPEAVVSARADRTIEATNKLAEIKARIERARSGTNVSPSQAQAVAGNYAKGKVSIHGNKIAIENPKGSIRSNKDPNGPAWSVKMPADYGYLEGTRGADGDPIDVYVGPDHDASYVYVIDQVDPDTRAFDEHKVMMGFKSVDAAVKAYDKAFSDGKGALRVGDLRKMSMPEFKTWSEANPSERSGMTEQDATELRSYMFADEFDAWEMAQQSSEREGWMQDPITGEWAQPLRSITAKEALELADPSGLDGVPRIVARMARGVLAKAAGDVQVHFIRPQDIKRLLNRDESQNMPFGYHAERGGKQVVVIRADLMNNPDKLRHVILHEVTHAATVRGIASKSSLKLDIYRMMEHVVNAIPDNDYASWNIASYSMTNPYEFIAEAFSNAKLQDLMSRMPAPSDLAASLQKPSGIASLWDYFVATIRKALGLPRNTTSMLELAIRATEASIKARTDFNATLAKEGHTFLEDGDMSSYRKSIKESLASITNRPELAPTKGNPVLLGFRTFDHIARAADRYFRGNNPVRAVANVVEAQRVAAIKEFDRAAPIIQKLHELQTRYSSKMGEGGKSVWENFATLLNDETMANVFADKPLAEQKHISKNGAKDSWARAQHPELARRFNQLPEDLKVARKEAMDYFTAKQNEVALKLIRNRIVTLFDTSDPEGLAQRIHNGSVTDADKALMGDAYDAIAAAGVLSKIDGPYYPLMRRGNYVVKGSFKVTSPGNAEAISPNEFQFKSKDDAAAFAARQQGRPTMRTVYVDKTTGKTTGNANGKEVRLTAQDFNAEPRYRVVVQNRHVEMFDTMKEARAHVAALRKAGYDVDDAVPRSFENYGIQADALSTQMRRLQTVLERRAEDRQFTDTQKSEMLATLNEVSLAMLGSTRIQSRSLPRQYVAGASKDLVRNTTDYAHAMGNYVAKLDHRPKLDAAMKDLSDAVRDNARDGFAAGRTAIQNEVLRRVTATNPAVENKGWNGLTSRILSMSFIDKLMSPSYSVINATQPMMISAPYLAGQYGVGKAYSAMSKAYGDIGALETLRRGFADTVEKMKPGNTIVPTDPVSLIRSRLANKGEVAMLDAMVERGSLDTDSGLEVGKLTQNRKGIVGKFDTVLGYTEGIARQMPKAIEAINRSVVALAAYRLEMGRSGDQARAIQFAQDTLNLTQFNYSASNAAPYMNHPALRLALQFKKYGVGMYQFLGEQAALAYHNAEPGDRARALKSLSYTIGMHVLIAGAMGLPTEPIKLVVTAANGLGITDWSWGDVENAQREAMAQLFGAEFGEIVSRGIPRAAGIDLSSRMGIDTLMGPFGEPRSNEAQDWKAYMWDALSGAPAGLVADWARGINDLAEGDIARAAERLVPVKVFSDSIKAYRQMTEGTISEKTGKLKMSPYSAGEAVMRAFGFQPAREAESFERSAMFNRDKEVQEAMRTEFQREWAHANGAARGRIWRDISRWNRSQPVEARLTLSELRGYTKRLRNDMKKTQEGIRARRREQHLLERANQTFNYEP